MLILGGNNRIRLVDLRHGCTWDMLKSGFDRAPILAELKVRQVEGNWPFPALRGVAADFTWYKSDYLNAIALNRLPKGVERSGLARQAFEILGQWLNHSIETVPSIEFGKSVCSEIETLLEQTSIISSCDREMIRGWVVMAQNVLRRITSNKSTTYIAWGHGDFQEGNILIDTDQKVWIVDWEHAGFRNLAYDYLVFALHSRFPAGLARLIQTANRDSEFLLAAIPLVHHRLLDIFHDPFRRTEALVLFLLQDLLWNLRENENPLFRGPSGAWLQLRKEIAPALLQLAVGCS